jgi:conjugal transfer pilus assembly protein TraD
MLSRSIEIHWALLFGGMLALALMVAGASERIPYGGHATPVFMGISLLSLVPALAWLRAWRARSALVTGELLHMDYDAVPKKPGETFLGLGFLWTPTHAEQLTQCLSQGTGAPEEVQIKYGGNTLIHGLGILSEAPIFLADAKRCHHALVMGSPGSGKTRFIELLLRQLIEKGDTVVIVDPKGDSRLMDVVEQACRDTGRLGEFRLVALPWPKSSVAYNPLTNFGTPSEIADRLIGILPPSSGDGEAFRGFQWGAVKAVVQGLYLASLPITIARVLEGLRDMAPLVVALVKRRFLELASDDVAQIASKYEAALVTGEMPRSTELDDLLSYLKLNPDYYQKMVASFIPQLERLSAGPKREILSPEPEDTKRQVLTWSAVDHQKLVVYFYLGSLHGEESANAVGKMLLLDFQAYVAKRYSYGTAQRGGQLSFFIDEAHHMVSKAFMNILAEARGANVSMVLASQTTAQFELSFGTRAAVDEILTMNFAYVQFQSRNHHEADTFSKLAGERLMRILSENHSYEPGFLSSGLQSVDDFRAQYSIGIQYKDAPLIPPWAIAQLPIFHFFARVGGRIYKGRIPLLEKPTSTFTEDLRREVERG